LKKIVEDLPDPKSPAYEAQSQSCLQDLLRLDKDLKVMKNLEKLKHIRRELNIILGVVTEQRNVIKQMTDDLGSGEFKDIFTSSADLCRRRIKRAEKLEQRREQILALDQRADNIFKDVSYLRPKIICFCYL